MPTYQIALKFALDGKHEKSLQKFELLLDEITDEHSTNTPYHVYALYKMATINNLAGTPLENEHIFERIAETAPMAYSGKSAYIFRCYNTLYKYYLNFDVEKCYKLGEEMLSSKYFRWVDYFFQD